MSELNPVRIAVIGAGAMGRNHIRFVTEEPEAELVAIADAFEGARATAEAAGVPFFTDPAQMMDEVKPEAVIIATPNDLHRRRPRGRQAQHRAAGRKADLQRPRRCPCLRRRGRDRRRARARGPAPSPQPLRQQGQGNHRVRRAGQAHRVELPLHDL